MIIKLLNDIAAYIGYLHETGLTVSIHDRAGGFFSFTHIISEYNIHKSPYCIFVKSCPEAWQHCIVRQKKIYGKLESEGAFFGMCYAGVEEYVFPVGEDEVIAFISVGGYGINRACAYERIAAVSEKYMLPKDMLLSIYESGLKHEMPNEELLGKVINPLCHLLMYLKNSMPQTSEISSPDTSYARAISYINKNYCSPLTIKDISRAVGYSVSTISHMFRKKSGYSLPEYISRLRIIQAKNYLKYTDMNMGEIAERLGFSNQNYFSNIFRKYEEMSPGEWRRAKKRF